MSRDKGGGGNSGWCVFSTNMVPADRVDLEEGPSNKFVCCTLCKHLYVYITEKQLTA